MEGRDDAKLVAGLLPTKDDKARDAELLQEGFALVLNCVVVDRFWIHRDYCTPICMERYINA